MKYMLLMTSTAAESCAPATGLTPEEQQANGAHMQQIAEELAAAGELVGGEGLTGPEGARIVVSDGAGAPVVTDGPFAESKEFLAGFWMIDVESEERALEIAARTSAAPGVGGRPSGRPIEVRAVMVQHGQPA